MQGDDGHGWLAMTKSDRALVLLLRIVGVGALFALVAVFMPVSWMAATHRCLGLGEMPTGPVVEYLARSVSAFYALMGALCLVLTTDLERYRPLVRFLGLAFPDEPGPPRRRSGGGDAVVVVRLRGARRCCVRGAAVRAGPPRLLERWNCMTLRCARRVPGCGRWNDIAHRQG